MTLACTRLEDADPVLFCCFTVDSRWRARSQVAAKPRRLKVEGFAVPENRGSRDSELTRGDFTCRLPQRFFYSS